MDYNSYIIKAILAYNKFEINEVKNLQTINSRCYIQDEYDKIEDLIENREIDALKSLPDNQGRSSEYLTVVEFKNQLDVFYIATIYDSDELWQDPEVIKIWPYLKYEE
jgi:hypothetical protein